MAKSLGVCVRRGERSAAERVEAEAFDGVGAAGRRGEESTGGTVDGRVGCVGVRSMSGLVGVDGTEMNEDMLLRSSNGLCREA